MQTPPALLFLGFLAAGAAGGAVVGILGPSSPVPAPTAPSLASSPGLAGEQVTSIQEALTSLDRRLDLLETAEPRSSRSIVSDSATITEDELADAIANALMGGDVEAAGLVSTISQVLDAREAQAELEREQARKDAQIEQIQRRVDRLTEDLGLVGDQPQRMFDALYDEDARRNELRDTMRNGGAADFGTVRDEMRALGDETKAVLSTFLTPDQLTTYSESNQGGRGGGFGGFGGAGGGRGARGG